MHRNLNYNEFILGIMTDEQVEFWRQYAHRGVCIDSTHGISRRKLKLVTVQVIGPKEVGVPVANLFVSNEKGKTLVAFFKEIKRRVGNDLRYDLLMSDDYIAYYNSFTKVFGPTRKLLCMFHVKQSWKRRLKKLVDSNVNGSQSYRSSLCYKMLQLSTDVADSRRGNEEVSRMMELEEAARRHDVEEFVHYFQNYYLTRKDEWMTRCRLESPVSTNNYCEGFHSSLKKDLRSDGSLMGRVDRVIYMVIQKVKSRVIECGGENNESKR